MKKHFGILLLSIASISLGGCDFIRIGKEKALERINDISDNLVYTDKVQCLQTRQTVDMTTESKNGDNYINRTANVYALNKFFTTINFVYSKLKTESTDLISGESLSIETETWKYIRGSKFYIVTSEIKNGVENKTYTVEKATKELKNDFKKEMKESIDKALNGLPRENAIESTLDIVKDETRDLDRKFISYGKGNLSVTSSYHDFEESSSGTVELSEYQHYEWKRYALKSSHTKSETHTVNKETSDYSLTKFESTFSFKTFFLPGFPRLRQFKKQ